MKWIVGLIVVALVGGLAAVVLVGPVGPVPGLFIGGEPAEVPARWPDTSAEEEILLQIPGFPQRVVTVWVTAYQGDLYVVGGKDSGWVTMIGTGSDVRMRLMGRTYDLYARPVAGDWQPILQAYLAKYRPKHPGRVASFPPLDEVKRVETLFRLARR